MIADGLILAAGSGFGIQMLDDARRGAAFPEQSNLGDLWELTVQVGQDVPGIYQMFDIWTLRSPAFSVLSYDVSGTVFGQPDPGAKVLFFVSPRAFKLQGTFAGAMAKALMPASSTQDFSIILTRGQQTQFLGVIRFEDGSDTGQFVVDLPQDVQVLRGDTLLVLAPDQVDASLADISITLCGFISA
jgi:hypothetical protein